jgi:hypothetical protein
MASIEIDGVNGVIKSTVSDSDLTIKGNDGGSEISALAFDMSDAGTATFNHDISLSTDGAIIKFGANSEVTLTHVHDAGLELSAAGNLDTLKLVSTDDDANVGPVLNYYRNSGNVADNDYVGRNLFTFNNDAPEVETALAQNVVITDASNGSEDVKYIHEQMTAGSVVERFTLSASEAVFNEGSVDVDFRVESNGDANMLFVDAGNNRVGIGTSSPGSVLQIDGASTPKLTIKTADGTSASIKLQRQDENDVYTDFELKNDGGVFKIISDNSSINERALVNFESSIVTFNEDSNDIDFRVESNGQTSKILVNAGTDQVFIGNNSQDLASSGLNVAGSGNDFAMGISNTDTSSGISFMKFTDGSGDQCGLITGDASNNSLALSSGSDYRLKENINYSWDATTELKKLKPAQFNMKKNTEKTILNGFIAHEIAEVLPEVVVGEKDETEVFENVVLNSDGLRIHRGITEEQWKEGKDKGKYAENTTWQESQTVDKMQTVDYAKLTPLLTKALQELEARIKVLEDA